MEPREGMQGALSHVGIAVLQGLRQRLYNGWGWGPLAVVAFVILLGITVTRASAHASIDSLGNFAGDPACNAHRGRRTSRRGLWRCSNWGR